MVGEGRMSSGETRTYVRSATCSSLREPMYVNLRNLLFDIYGGTRDRVAETSFMEEIKYV